MDEKLRILLCEDDENLGMLLREYLQAKGYSAELYPDGEAGFKAFLKNKYDLCVFDVMMPKKDGFTLAQDVDENAVSAKYTDGVLELVLPKRAESRSKRIRID